MTKAIFVDLKIFDLIISTRKKELAGHMMTKMSLGAAENDIDKKCCLSVTQRNLMETWAIQTLQVGHVFETPVVIGFVTLRNPLTKQKSISVESLIET
jgi:hypothetical protein